MSLANRPRISVRFETSKLTVELADDLGIDVQAVCEKALRAEVERRYKEEHREAFEQWNAWVEENGLPLAKYRLI